MKRLALIAVLVVGCSPSSLPLASLLASPVPVIPSQSASLSPSPAASPDPETLRKVAAAAYLKAAAAANAARAKVDKRYPLDMTLKQARAYYAAHAKIDGAFVLALKKIVVPEDTKADLRTLIIRTTAMQALDLEMSKARSIADINAAARDITRTARAATAAANQLRLDLGLPPVTF